MRLAKGFERPLALAAASGALFYVGFAAYSGFHKVVFALEHYAWATAAGALALVGVGALAGGERIAWVALALVGVAVLCVASERLAHRIIDLVGGLPGVGKLAPKLREFYGATKELLAPAPLVLATLLSVVA